MLHCWTWNSNKISFNRLQQSFECLFLVSALLFLLCGANFSLCHRYFKMQSNVKCVIYLKRIIFLHRLLLCMIIYTINAQYPFQSIMSIFKFVTSKIFKIFEWTGQMTGSFLKWRILWSDTLMLFVLKNFVFNILYVLLLSVLWTNVLWVWHLSLTPVGNMR